MVRPHRLLIPLGWVALATLIGIAVLTGWRHRTAAPRPDLLWGTTVIPYPTGVETQATVDEVMQRAKDLGLSVVRCEIPFGAWNDKERFRTVDAVVDAANRANLAVDLIIQPNWEPGDNFFEDPDFEATAKDRATRAATHFKGKVQYYQLGNEISAASLKPSWSGARSDAYDEEKYQRTLAWLAATGSTIRSIDPGVKLMTTANWLQYGFFERAFKDGLDIDILGWDWFDETQNLHQLTEEGQSVDLLEKLHQFKKPIWFVEAGYSADRHSEAEQAELDDAFVRDLAKDPAVQAIMIHGFTDASPDPGGEGKHGGIIRLARPTPDTIIIGEPKPAYHRLQTTINELSGR